MPFKQRYLRCACAPFPALPAGSPTGFEAWYLLLVLHVAHVVGVCPVGFWGRWSCRIFEFFALAQLGPVHVFHVHWARACPLWKWLQSIAALLGLFIHALVALILFLHFHFKMHESTKPDLPADTLFDLLHRHSADCFLPYRFVKLPVW